VKTPKSTKTNTR